MGPYKRATCIVKVPHQMALMTNFGESQKSKRTFIFTFVHLFYTIKTKCESNGL